MNRFEALERVAEAARALETAIACRDPSLAWPKEGLRQALRALDTLPPEPAGEVWEVTVWRAKLGQILLFELDTVDEMDAVEKHGGRRLGTTRLVLAKGGRGMTDYLAGWRAGVEAAREAAGFSAWKYEGDDAYSRGLDAGAAQQVRACVTAIRALPEPEAPDGWEPISTAPRDGTRVWLYVAGTTCGWEDPAMHLPPFQCEAAYHPDGGWCVDELREATHWRPLPAPPKGNAT